MINARSTIPKKIHIAVVILFLRFLLRLHPADMCDTLLHSGTRDTEPSGYNMLPRMHTRFHIHFASICILKNGHPIFPGDIVTMVYPGTPRRIAQRPHTIEQEETERRGKQQAPREVEQYTTDSYGIQETSYERERQRSPENELDARPANHYFSPHFFQSRGLQRSLILLNAFSERHLKSVITRLCPTVMLQ